MTLRRPALIALVALFPGSAAAQATVSGVVWDNLTNAPLARAVVQLVHADSISGRSVVADTAGRFTLGGVAPAKYRIGFIHPMLDSLGLDPILREVTVVGAAPVEVSLGIPPAARLRAAMCPQSAGKAVVSGFVRDARDESPIAGATVAADWLEFTFQKGGVVRVMPRADAITAANGWFALCNVPADGLMGLFAAKGADSTDVLDVHVPESGFLRHDLYLGGGRDGRLTGKVVSAASGQRIMGAQVKVANGTAVRANHLGDWTLGDLPMGTRVIDVRAVGFYPERRGVHVTTGAPPLRIGLSELRAVLDTVRIRAARLQDKHESGFEERRRRGGGVYLTTREIERKQAHNTADIFRGVRGIRFGFMSDTLLSDANMLVDPDSMKTTQPQILMRGISGDLCAPSVFLNGVYVARIGADDLDTWATPREISAIEIYSEATVPAQFQRIGKACGSIVIWTKR